MKTIPVPPDEAERQQLIRHLEMLDVAPANFFDEITRVVEKVCDAPLAMVCLAPAYQCWFRTNATHAAPEREFCQRQLPQDAIRMIPDTLTDEQVRNDPAVTHGPRLRFYAGAPLTFSPGVSLGLLCVVDYRPRMLDEKQTELLGLLATHVVTLVRLRLDKLEDHRGFGEMALSKQRLQYRKELLEAVLDNEPESVHILSRGGEVMQINPAGLEMLEVGSLDELRQRKLADFVQPEYLPTYAALLDRVFGGQHGIAEYRITGAKGTGRWMESHAAPLHDRHGEVVSLVAITRDITRAKAAQQQLELAARVFGEAQEGIIITDAAGTIVDVNPAFCRISGYAREEVIGQNPRLLHSGKQGPDFYAVLWQTLLATGRWKGEMWNRKKNGELYAELISINALRDENGNILNFVAIFLDVTSFRPAPPP